MMAVYTPGNIVVNRIGTGGAALSSAATPVSLVEFTTAGVNQNNTIDLPSFTTGGNNQGGFTDTGTATSNGFLSLSPDGRYLTLIGIDAQVGSAGVTGTSATTANRNVATIDSSGIVSIEARLTDAHSANSVRGAITSNGNDIWTVGAGGAGTDGVRYVDSSTGVPTTSTQIASGNLRNVGIFGNVLFTANTTSISSFDAPNTPPKVTTAGTPLTFTTGGIVGGSGAFLFLDRDAATGATNLNGLDTLYVVDGSGIEKYEWTGAGWTQRGAATYSGTLFGVTAQVTGGNVDLYATTNIASNNSLIKVTDSTGFGGTLAAAAANFTVLASAGANFAFRGVAFAPASADTAAPVISSLSPLDNAVNVPVASNLVATFNENVAKGTGNILIKRLSDNSVVQTIDVTSAAVSIEVAAVIIDPADFVGGVDYYVEIPATAIKDLAGNFFAGIAGSTTWNYQVTLPTSSDLIVDSITTSTEVIAGQSIPIEWVIKNQGSAPATGTWQDQVLISADSVIGSDIALGTFEFTGTLLAGQSITRTQAISIPGNLSGTKKIVVRTDSTNTIFEPSNEGNNASIDDQAFNVIPPAVPNLIIDSINAPTTAFSDRDVTIDWITKNIGVGATNSLGWVDRVYLSLDSVLDGGDVQLGSVQNGSYLNPGDTYRSVLTAKLPRGIDGSYRFIVVADANNSLAETGFESDNTTVSSVTTVTLTPPPDLRVTSVTAPSSVFSGETIQVGWTITNAGTGPTIVSSWQDQIYLSFGDNQLDASDRLLTTRSHSGELQPGGAYSVAGVDVTLPIGISGSAFFIVRTDSSNQVYEHVFETNNVSSTTNATNVLLTPPPDLTVTSFNIPTSAVAGQPFVVTYTVTNEGSTATPNSSWSDAIYLSTDTTLDTSSDLLLGVRSRNGVLDASQSETKAYTFTLPNTLSGTFYAIVSNDSTNDVFEIDNANNVVASTTTTGIAINPPDLTVNSVSTTSVARSGRSFSLGYSVTNSGNSPTPISTWNDGFYLSTDATLDAADVLLSQQLRTGVLAVNQVDPRTATFQLPVDRIGSFFILAVSDNTDSVFELNNGNNSRALPITILDDRPDLAIRSFTARTGTGSVAFGSTLAFDYEVENRGVGATFGNTWNDVLVLSSDSTIGNSDDLVLGTYSSPSALSAGSSYLRSSLNFTIPVTVAPGNYHLFFRTDNGNSVTESVETNNNSSSIPLTITLPENGGGHNGNGLTVSDLQISSLVVPTTVASGTDATISWTVTNAGVGRTSSTAWVDRVWLSQDGLISNDDVSLGSFSRTEGLATGQSYTRTISSPINIDLSGSFRIIVETDASNTVYEGTNETNNVRVGDTSTTISLSPTADLAVTATNLPAELTSGRSATLSWTVTNNGAETTGTWSDSVYLSLDQVLDQRTDISLGYLTRAGGVAANQSYTATGSFDIPLGIGGRYYVIVVVDSTNRVYERNAETNNKLVASPSVNVVHTLPADLVVGDITIPANGSLGQNATISFTVSNNGQNPARGSWSDAIYISSDDVWDINDGFFGRVAHSGDVLAGGSYTSTLTAALPGVLPGDYKVIVRSDIRNNLVESNEANNLTASLNQFDIEVPALELGVSANGSIGRNKGVYYKFAVEANQTVVIEFDSALASGYTELFASFGEVPRRSKADFSGSAPLQTDQRIVISSTKAGIYYVLTYGTDIPVDSSEYSIRARVIPFTVFDTSFGAGGSSGDRTIVINGAKFDRTVTASLLGEGGRQIDAVRYTRVNETLLFATFDLRGLPHQQYNVRITKPTTGESTTISNGFTVVSSSGQLRNPTVTAPTFYDDRSPNPIPVTVGWYNDTLNDIQTPLVNFSSTSPFATSYSDALKGKTVNSITYLGYSNSDGPVDVLIPGASVTTTFYVRPAGGELIYPSAAFVYDELNEKFEWTSTIKRLTLRDENIQNKETILNAFVTDQGATVRDFRRTLAEGLRLLGKPPSRHFETAEPQILQAVFDDFAASKSAALTGVIQYSEFDIAFTNLRIVATNSATNLQYVADVSTDGTFSIPFLTPGDFSVRVLGGARTIAKDAIVQVKLDEATQLDLAVVRSASFRGTVTDSTTNESLSDAHVIVTSLLNSDYFEILTDSLGRFAFLDLSSGIYDIHVNRPGFAGITITREIDNTSALEEIIIALPKAGIVGGVIRTSDGTFPGDSVVLAVSRSDKSTIIANVNDDSTYAFDGLANGLWSITVQSKRYTQPTPVELLVTASERIVLNFDLEEGVTLTGRVLSANAPIADASIEIFDSENRSISTISDSLGVYSIEGIKKNSPLSVQVQSSGFARFASIIPPFGTEKIRVIDFSLEQGRTFSGQVRTSEGVPVSLAKVVLNDLENGRSFNGTTNIDGDFTLGSLLPSKYELLISSVGFAETKSQIDVNAGDLLNDSYVLHRLSSLVGLVRRGNGSSITEGEVLLMRQNDGLSLVTAVNSEGRYLFTNTPLGLYDVWYVSADRSTTSSPYQITIIPDSINEKNIEVTNATMSAFGISRSMDTTIGEIEFKVDFAQVEADKEEQDLEQLSVRYGTLRDRLAELARWVKVDTSQAIMPITPSLPTDCNVNYDLLESLQKEIRDFKENATNAYIFGLQDQQGVQARNYALYLTNRSKFELLFASASTKLQYVKPIVENLIRIVDAAKLLGSPGTVWSTIENKVAAPASRILGWLDGIDAALNFLGITASDMNGALNNMANALDKIQQSQEKRDQLSRDYIGAVATAKSMVERFNILLESGKLSSGLQAPSATRSGLVGQLIQGNILASIIGKLIASGANYSATLTSGAPNFTLLPDGQYAYFSFEPANVTVRYQLRASCGASGEDISNGTINVVIEGEPIRPQPRSVDPNDIIGPIGYDEDKWISASQTSNYMIRFENDALLAQAPAQIVRIVQTLDSDLDARSFRLGQFGFGGQTFDVPENRSYFSTRLDVRSTLGVFVDVVANIDVANREIFWLFTAIDPATGEVPDNPLVGFLPPNITAPEGDGFVSYTVRGRSSSPSGSRVDAVARIFFDDNAPIDTPPIFNSLDTSNPTSALTVMPSLQSDAQFRLSWSGGDGDVGSGLQSYDIFVSENGSEYVRWLSDTTLTSAEFAGTPEKTYAFYSVARDNVGNLELPPLSPDVVISIFGSLTAPSIPTLSAATDLGASRIDHRTANNLPVFVGTGIPGNQVVIYSNGVVLAQGPIDANGNYSIQPDTMFNDGTYTITAEQIDGTNQRSPMSGAMVPPLVIDTIQPTGNVAQVVPLIRNASVDQYTFTFSEPVAPLTIANLQLRLNDGTNLLTTSQTLSSSDGGVTWVLGNLGGVIHSSGRYILTMLPSSIIDLAGNSLELTPPVGSSHSAEAVLVLHPPTNLPFNQRVIEENTPTTTDVLFGTLSVVDADTVDSFVYSLVSGQGSADNNRFRIAGNQLFIKQGEVLDFETKPTFAVRVRVTDSIGNTYERALVLALTNVNEAPIDLNLSSSSIVENGSPNEIVGTLITSDPEPFNIFTYTLVNGEGDTDNSAFNIDGGNLRANYGFDLESKSSYSVRVRTTDRVGLWFEKIFTINVSDVDENVYLSGLAGNDIITARYTGDGVQHAWSVTRNGTSMFSGSILNGGGLVIDGLDGEDTLQIVGRAGADAFFLGTNQVITNQANTRFLNTETVRILGGSGDDSLRYEPGNAAFSGTVSFDGGTGIDTAEAFDGNNIWSITGVGIGSLNNSNRSFSTIESLVGGSGNDQFVFAALGRLTGKVRGGSGSDEINFAAKTSGHTVNLETHTATSTGGIGEIEAFVGSNSATAIDVLIGANSVTSWMIDGANAGSLSSTSIGSIVFDDFESITGGTATDHFAFGLTGSLSKTLSGGAATDAFDTLDLSAKSEALEFQLNTTSSLPGTIGAYTGIEQITANGDPQTKITRINDIATAWIVNALGQIVVNRVTYSGVGSIAGGPGLDTMTGPAVEGAWSIESTNSGSLSIPAANVRFTGIENLTGSTASDTFTIESSGSVTGTLNGGSGSDSLNLSAKSGALDFQLNTKNSLPGTIGAYTGIEQITANGDSLTKITRINDIATAWVVNASGQVVVNRVTYSGVGSIAGGPGLDTITGPAVDSSWSIESTNSGSLSFPAANVRFTGIENLTGSTASDTFTIESSGRVTGTLNAGSGSDSLNLSAKSGALEFQLNTTSSLPGTIGAYIGIEQITANGDTQTKITRINDIATAWVVNALGQVVVNRVTYSGVGSIAGGPGLDTITGPAVDSSWSIESTNGGSLSFPAANVRFTGIENLTGSTASDTFEIVPGGSLDGNLNGGTGTGINSLSYAQWTLGVSVNLAIRTPANATGISGITNNIRMVTGGSGSDTLTGQASTATILIGLDGNDRLVGGLQRDILFAGRGSDVLKAGSGDDLLISGTTIFDTNRAAILQIFDEWTSSRNFAQRTANIWGNGTDPRLNDNIFLNNNPLDEVVDTVLADSDLDELLGGIGQDWFFASESDLFDFLGTGKKEDRKN